MIGLEIRQALFMRTREVREDAERSRVITAIAFIVLLPIWGIAAAASAQK